MLQFMTEAAHPSLNRAKLQQTSIIDQEDGEPSSRVYRRGERWVAAASQICSNSTTQFLVSTTLGSSELPPLVQLRTKLLTLQISLPAVASLHSNQRLINKIAAYKTEDEPTGRPAAPGDADRRNNYDRVKKSQQKTKQFNRRIKF